MDLFNKKKVKNLEREIRIVREEFERTKGKLIALEDFKCNAQENLHLIKENQKLIEWVEKILEEFGTVEARGEHISIPICKRGKEAVYYNENSFASFVKEKEYIEIPAITIIKMR